MSGVGESDKTRFHFKKKQNGCKIKNVKKGFVWCLSECEDYLGFMARAPGGEHQGKSITGMDFVGGRRVGREGKDH